MNIFYENMPHGLCKTILMIIKFNIINGIEFNNKIRFILFNFFDEIFYKNYVLQIMFRLNLLNVVLLVNLLIHLVMI